MEYFVRIMKESIIIVIISSIMGLISGTLLSFNEGILYSLPIILLILPSMNSLIGDISTVLVSRLTTHLYIGTISPKIENSEQLREDFLGLLMTLILSFALLIGLGYGIAYFTDILIVNPFLIIFVLLLTILILFGSLFFILFISSIYLFRSGKDPNNFLIPAITSLADFLTPLLLITFIIIFS